VRHQFVPCCHERLCADNAHLECGARTQARLGLKLAETLVEVKGQQCASESGSSTRVIFSPAPLWVTASKHESDVKGRKMSSQKAAYMQKTSSEFPVTDHLLVLLIHLQHTSCSTALQVKAVRQEQGCHAEVGTLV